jgi:hypothetical protein
MARPKQDPEQAFMEETSIWQAAIRTNGAFFPTESPKRAIHVMHRLNMARAAIREKYGHRFLAWDGYVVRSKPDGVSIEPKRELVDLFEMRDLQGNKVDPAVIVASSETPIVPRPDNEIKPTYTPKLGPPGPDPDKAIGGLETD